MNSHILKVTLYQKKMLWTKYENSDVLKFIFECFLWNFSILLDFCLKVVFSIPQIPYIII